jgi:hypothetical protein
MVRSIGVDHGIAAACAGSGRMAQTIVKQMRLLNDRN